MSKTQVKNLTSSEITIDLPAARFLRKIQPNQAVPLPDEAAEEFTYDEGCRNFVKDGFIQLITENENILAAAPEVKAASTAAEVDVDDILKNASIADFAKTLKEATPALRDKIVERAIALSIADAPHCNLIKTYTGMDILKTISLQHE